MRESPSRIYSPLPKCEKCGEKACGRPCVPDEELSLLRGNVSAQTGDSHFMIGFIELNIEAQSL